MFKLLFFLSVILSNKKCNFIILNLHGISVSFLLDFIIKIVCCYNKKIVFGVFFPCNKCKSCFSFFLKKKFNYLRITSSDKVSFNFLSFKNFFNIKGSFYFKNKIVVIDGVNYNFLNNILFDLNNDFFYIFIIKNILFISYNNCINSLLFVNQLSFYKIRKTKIYFNNFLLLKIFCFLIYLFFYKIINKKGFVFHQNNMYNLFNYFVFYKLKKNSFLFKMLVKQLLFHF